MSRKKIFISIVIVIIILISAFFVYINIQKSSLPPRVTLSEEEGDFGKVKEDERPSHIFTIKNTGGKELIINRVRAACGCTATMLSSDHIPPGKSAELQVTFNPTGYNGPVKKDVYIESNDPKLPNTKIIVMLDAEPIPSPEAFISNSQWDLGLISQGDAPTFTFTIENRGVLDLIIEKIDVSEYILYDIIVPLNLLPGEKQEITFTYDSTNHILGEVRESVRISSNDPKRKAFSLHINGYIKEMSPPSINIFPLELKFNLLGNAEGELVKKINFQNSGKNLIKVVSLTTSSDYLVPLRSEVELDSGEEKDLAIVLLKDKMQDEEKEEYLYITIALPIVIEK